MSDAPGSPSPPRPPRPLRRMPEVARALGHPWPSLVGEVEGLTPETERDFRFGQSVFAFDGEYRLGGSLKGGSSAVWRPVAEAEHRAYVEWRAREAFGESEDPEAFAELVELLSASNVALVNLGQRTPPRGSAAGAAAAEQVPGRGEVYRLAVDLLLALPAGHIERSEFAALQIGGWGPDSAKASAYADGRVMLYEFALGGARRTFVGLFLHELGHVHEAALSPADRARLEALHGPIASAGALLGLEFLLDGESRRIYQQFLTSEFLAETYVVYTTQGARLRAFAGEHASERVREAWAEVYEIFRNTFFGVEYE